MSTLIQTYHQYPIKIVRGQGCTVWDSTGKSYVDFYGGHAVCLLGHCPPAVVQAIHEQSQQLLFYSNIFVTTPNQTLADLLVHTLQPQSYQAYFANSGSEANETALKIARKYAGKQHVIAFKNSFHGRSIYALGVTGIDSYHQFQPHVTNYTDFAELGNLASVERLVTSDTAAIICEPIQSIGGVHMATAKFYQDLAAFCTQKNILLIFDEVQTGLGRTGTFWFSQGLDIYPDIITTAKGLASGLPLSAVLVKSALSETIKVGEHATTFGGGPVVCAAAVATVSTLLAEGFLAAVKLKAQYLRAALMTLPAVAEVRGQGLLLGVRLHHTPSDFIQHCLEAGLIIGSSSEPTVFRLMPPLTISLAEIDQCIAILSSQFYDS